MVTGNQSDTTEPATDKVSLNTAFACLCCQMFSSGLVAMYGFFVNPLSEYFGVGKATIGSGQAMLFVCSALIGPFLGILLDKVAIKRVMLSGITVAGAALIFISQADTIVVVGCFYVLFCCGFMLYGPLSTNVLLTKTYKQHLPRALGIAALGVSIGGIVTPLIIAQLMLRYEWQGTLMAMGIFLIVAVGLAVFLLIPRQTMDAASSLQKDQNQPEKKHYREKAFWIIGLSFAMLLSVAIVNSFSLVPHLQQLGYSVTDAAWLFSLTGAAGFAGKAGFALLSDKIRPQLRWILAGIVLSGASGYLLVAASGTLVTLLLGCVLMGICVGISIPMQPFLNNLYFGKNNAGAVNGLQSPLFLPFGIGVAPLTGWVFDTTSSYSPAFYGAAVVTILVLVLLMQLPPQMDDELKS